MKLYHCRHKDDSKKFFKVLSPVRNIPVFSDKLSEAFRTASLSEILERVKAYPEFVIYEEEVAEAVPWKDVVISDCISEKFEEAEKHFQQVLFELSNIAPVMFCNIDDNGTVMEFFNLVHDVEDGKVYIELKYPQKGAKDSVSKLSLK